MITETAPLPRPRTGRAVVLRKRRVDECLRLDLRDLRRAGLFAQPTGTGRRLGGCPTRVACGLLPAAGGGHWFVVADLDPDGAEPTPAPLLAARLEWMPCHFGGVRWWFNCPRVVQGRECGRRCRILFLPRGAGQVGCRGCLRLTYRTRQQHRSRLFAARGRIESTQRFYADLGSRAWRRRLRAMCRIDPKYVKLRRTLNQMARVRRAQRDPADG